MHWKYTRKILYNLVENNHRTLPNTRLFYECEWTHLKVHVSFWATFNWLGCYPLSSCTRAVNYISRYLQWRLYCGHSKIKIWVNLRNWLAPHWRRLLYFSTRANTILLLLFMNIIPILFFGLQINEKKIKIKFTWKYIFLLP